MVLANPDPEEIPEVQVIDLLEKSDGLSIRLEAVLSLEGEGSIEQSAELSSSNSGRNASCTSSGVYTEDEISATLAVRKELIETHGFDAKDIPERPLVICTMLSKCRIEDSVEAFKKLRSIMEQYGIKDFEAEFYADPEYNSQFIRAVPCGNDENHGRGTMLIDAGPIPVADETKYVRASLNSWMAVFADINSLREGINLMICAAKSSGSKHGNEKKLQKTWQGIPSRPQWILIYGTSYVTRTIIKVVIAFAATFSKAKILDRIRFDTFDVAFAELGKSCICQSRGGTYPYTDSREDRLKWIMDRHASFPSMNLETA